VQVAGGDRAGRLLTAPRRRACADSMPITHHPFEIHLGPIPLTGFGLAVVLAFVLSQFIAQRELERRGHHKEAEAIPDLIIAAIVGTLVGGKLYYAGVITHDWRDLFSRSGFVFWGGFTGAVIANWLVIRYRRLNFLRFSDVAGICIAAGYSVGRTGCWAVGDDYGRPWHGPLAVLFPNGSPPSTAQNMAATFHTAIPPGVSPDTVLAVYPTQLFEVALGFVMFLVLWRLREHRHAEGWLFGMYCVLAGLERFVIEFFRAKDDRLLGGFTYAQVIALAVVAVGVAWMAARRRTGPGRPGVHAAAGAG
jgi:phosphatidylglycerol:prolipoprotein diacylglycerol transferase